LGLLSAADQGENVCGSGGAVQEGQQCQHRLACSGHLRNQRRIRLVGTQGSNEKILFVLLILKMKGDVIASSFGKIGSVRHVEEPAEPSDYDAADVIRQREEQENLRNLIRFFFFFFPDPCCS
jgi:hypothetical protein